MLAQPVKAVKVAAKPRASKILFMASLHFTFKTPFRSEIWIVVKRRGSHAAVSGISRRA
jgi:hypothetical protein